MIWDFEIVANGVTFVTLIFLMNIMSNSFEETLISPLYAFESLNHNELTVDNSTVEVPVQIYSFGLFEL